MADDAGSAYPEKVTVSGAGTAEANGVYVYRPDSEAKRVAFGIRCVRGIYEHTTNDACWLGFHDCAAFGRPEWNKWMLYNARGILYAAHTPGQLGVPPRKGRWEISSLGKIQNVGAHPPPHVGHGSTVPHDVCSEKDVGFVSTTDASRVGSFKLVLATEPSRALAKAFQYDLDDQSNAYGASMKLTDFHAAATFCFAADHEHVSLEADRYLGLAVNCAQYVEGGSCCLLCQKKAPEGGSGNLWKINSDGTLSPKGHKNLVLGFGPITYDSWNRREQTADSIGGAGYVAIGLVARASAQRLIVHSTDVLVATQPSAMSRERESAKYIISAKSLYGCSCDMGFCCYVPLLACPGVSCIRPHPSAPDSEDVFERWALHGCVPVTNERWERCAKIDHTGAPIVGGDQTNVFRRTEGGPCDEGNYGNSGERILSVARACGCCLCAFYCPLPTGCEIGVQPTYFHGVWSPEWNGRRDRSQEWGSHHSPYQHQHNNHSYQHHHMGYSQHFNPSSYQGQYGQY